MDVLAFHTVFVSLINIVGIYLCFIVFFSNQKRPLRYIFVCMMVSMFVWVDFAYLARVYGSSGVMPLLFLRIAWFITPVFFTFLYFFTIYLIGEVPRYGKLNMAMAIIGGIMAAVCGFTDLVIYNFRYISEAKNIEIIYGSGMMQFFAIIFIIVCATLVPLFAKFGKISAKEKLKLEYYIIGICIFYIANTIYNIILPAFMGIADHYYLGDYSTIFFLMLTAYAITKHNLMEVKIFLAETMVFLIFLVLSADLVFFSAHSPMRFAKLFVLIAFLYFGRRLILNIRKEEGVAEKIRKANLVLAERNKDLQILLKASDMVSQELDSRKISQDIADSIPETLKHLGYIIGVVVLYKNKKDCAYVYAVTDSALTRRIESEMQVSIKGFSERLSKNSDLVAKTIKNKKIYASGDLKAFLENFIGEGKGMAVREAAEARSLISIPLFSAGKVIGAIVFLNRNSLDSITKRNKEIVKAFVSHIGPAIENAKLYEKTNIQMKELSALNKDLKKANVRLKELLELKDEFLHITSHQLRTPLTAIRGMISMWMEGDYDKLPAGEKDEMIRRIYASTERLNNVTNDMLDALELEGGLFEMEFKRISLMEMINGAVLTLRPDYERKGLYLRFGEVDKNIPEIEAESNYMSQVFLNLIDNACKYTRTGGTEIDVRNSGSFVDVYIRDTGIGMDEKVIRKAFEKFTRGENAVKENASGSGLGLFIVKKILDEHNGKIAVHSAGLDKGTTFKVSLLIKQKQTYDRGKYQNIAKRDKQ